MLPEITIILLILALLITLSLLFYQAKKTPTKPTNNPSQNPELTTLTTQLTNSAQEIQNLKELFLTNFAAHKASFRERFDYLDKSFAELNKIFASSKRGMLGNSYLNELLGIILPRDNQVYQLEYVLQKTTDKGEGLRVDAIIFGTEKKNNLAIDSKFPLDNYLLMIDESQPTNFREQAQKNFQNDLKKHVDKTSQYLSEEDSIYQCVMFLPSDTIYLAINELRFYHIVENACQKKVWICSPTTLYIVLKQIILANRNWELHQNSAKILQAYLEVCQEFTRFAKRWKEVNKTFASAGQKIQELEVTVNKILEKNEKLQRIGSGKDTEENIEK